MTIEYLRNGRRHLLMNVPNFISVSVLIALLKGVVYGTSALHGLIRLYREARDVMGGDR